MDAPQCTTREKGNSKDIKKGLELKFINIFEFIFISSFSFLKYIRRFFITKMR